MEKTVINGKELSKITLGTVQLGMNYGIANLDGQPSSEKSFGMLRCALDNGITSLDTARTYGNSEDVIGEFFRSERIENMPFITSKLKVNLPQDATEKEVEAAMYNSVETSLSKLGIERLDCLMLHSASDMTAYGEIVPKTLEAMVKKGYTSMAGVSVYQPEELDTMLKNDIYEATQVPMSVFDQKLIHKGYIKRLKERNIAVFVRSVFLQGVFFLEPEKITDPLLIEYAKPYIEILRDYCKTENMSIAEFAISYIRDTEGVTSLVLGADTKEQVMENIKYINAPAISEKTRAELSEKFKEVNIAKIMQVLSRPKK
ncbi:MAG: aldo/keto reductase [Firmicutes bacterium]|nr:aldo/keto reductase [Bacillota bacterium]